MPAELSITVKEKVYKALRGGIIILLYRVKSRYNINYTAKRRYIRS